MSDDPNPRINREYLTGSLAIGLECDASKMTTSETRALAEGWATLLIARTPQEQPRRFTDEEREALLALTCEIGCVCYPCKFVHTMLAESAPESSERK